jgi:hypothetical protein
MKREREMCTALFAAVVLASGCQPSNDQAPDAVPAGAIPAAPDVRPGTEVEPAATTPTAAEGEAGDRVMPLDTVQSGTGGTAVDTVGMRRP